MERKEINNILNKIILLLMVISIYFISFEHVLLKTTTIWLLAICLCLVNIFIFKESYNYKAKGLKYFVILDIILIILSLFSQNIFISFKFIILFSSAIFIFGYLNDKIKLYDFFLKLIVFFSNIYAYITILSVFFKEQYFSLINFLFSDNRVEIITGLYNQKCFSGIAGQTGSNSVLITIGLLAIIVLILYKKSNKIGRNLYRYFSLLILIAGLLLSNKRFITIIVVFLSLLIIFIYSKNKNKKENIKVFLVYTMTLLYAAFLLICFSDTFALVSRSLGYVQNENSQNLGNSNQNNDKNEENGILELESEDIIDNVLNGRIELYEEAIIIFKENPVVGIGLDNYTHINNIQTHNSILQLLSETGIIGTMSIITVLCYVLFITLINIKKYKDDKEYNYIYLYAFIGELLILTYSLTGNPFHDFNQRNFYFIMIAFLFGIIENSNKQKKEIGILTFHASQNYGAVLQAYALNKKLGSKCEIINYYSKPVYDYYSPFSVKKYGGLSLKNILKTIYKLPYNLIRLFVFNDFRYKYLPSSERIYNKRELENYSNNYKCLVTGSDQVWNSDITKEDCDIYYLNFQTEAKKYSYAASIGKNSININEEKILKKISQEYHSITVREERLQTILSDLKIKSEVVVDPTLLLTKNEWEEIASKNEISKDYIFVYALEETKEFINVVNAASNKYNLPIVHLGNKKLFENVLLNNYKASPNEFITLLKNAKYVVTNSFHGTVFSIIFNKNFISVPHTTRSVRQENLLERVNLKEHLTTNVEVLKNNYKEVNMDKLREGSIKFIEKIKDYE
ncbi:MAG: polysaccharide pyruvyl transferase family protein [Bacilli bacterium]|nr:polysaccharide pyruvyl transferase family protein [Bacilli bacterium]